MSRPNMENKLALIWRENVRKLMHKYNLNLTQLAVMTGKSSTTMQANFGGTSLKQNPHQSTMIALEKEFMMLPGSLSRSEFEPPQERPLVQPIAVAAEPTAMLSLPVSEDKLERILRILFDERD